MQFEKNSPPVIQVFTRGCWMPRWARTFLKEVVTQKSCYLLSISMGQARSRDIQLTSTSSLLSPFYRQGDSHGVSLAFHLSCRPQTCPGWASHRPTHFSILVFILVQNLGSHQITHSLSLGQLCASILHLLPLQRPFPLV